MKTSLKRNLFLGLGLSLFILLISSLASYISIKNLIQSSELVRKNNEVIESLNNIIFAIQSAETGQRGYLLTGNPDFLEPYNKARGTTAKYVEAIRRFTVGNPSQQKYLNRLEDDITSRMEILKQNLDSKMNGNRVSSESLMAGKFFMDDIRDLITKMKEEEQKLLDMQTRELNKLADLTPAIIIITALLAIAIILFFFRRVISDYNEKESLQMEVERKNVETIKRIDAIERVASQISEGQYDIRLEDAIKDGLGSLAGSVNKMAHSLKHSFGKLEEREWLQTGIASLNNKMVGEKNVQQLGNEILANIAAYTKSKMAALYILETDRLILSASYAVEHSKVKSTLLPGEGVCGQCFSSGETILLKDIDSGEKTISFASGKTVPKNIVAIPIFFYRRKIGVMEFGALHDYSSVELQYLNEVAQSIGIAINAAESRKRLQELLEETQSQAEELQSQHSELENINAELEAQSQKLQASEEELRVQQEELMQSNQELEERTSLLEEKNHLVEERNKEIQQKSRELELSSKYKSEFLANMSHELRTPLNSILLLSNLMVESKELSAEYVEYADVIQSSGQGLLTLIDEILDLSKIEAGKMDLDPDNVTVDDIIQDIKSLFLPIAKNKGLQFKVHVAEGTVPQLYTDKLRLEQILKNLISNAIKFTKQGEVKLSVCPHKDDEKIVFKVSDTGIGIAKEKQALIFEAFQQADGSTKRKFGGTGLGLSISKELARLLNAQLSVSSIEGEGSEFVLVVPFEYQMIEKPLEEPKKAELPAQEVVHQPLNKYLATEIPAAIPDDRDSIQNGDKVILIVEDDTTFAKVLLEYTRERDYKGIVAVRGDEGVKLAEHYRPRAILLDIQLPVLNGWQVMETLKSNPATRSIPVHIMSSFKVKRESLLKGAVDFIDKPFSTDQLSDVFRKLEETLNKHPKKVLVIEENNQHAKALRYFLNTHSINTEISSSINESISSLHKKEVDCVILDMGVPGRSAFETLQTIKETPGLEQIPIIVFTGTNLSMGEESRIKKFADSIVVKTAHSYQRILDETGLFLHLIEENNKPQTFATSNYENQKELRNVLKDKTVLIADDDVRNIFSLTKALEQQNMKVVAATDGKEALEVLLEHHEVDVILMDMMMPEMDGYETIRKIRALPKFKKVPIIAVTAKAMMGDREKCISAGASDYISKPVDLDQLVSLLRVWLYDKI